MPSVWLGMVSKLRYYPWQIPEGRVSPILYPKRLNFPQIPVGGVGTQYLRRGLWAPKCRLPGLWVSLNRRGINSPAPDCTNVRFG